MKQQPKIEDMEFNDLIEDKIAMQEFLKENPNTEYNELEYFHKLFNQQYYEEVYSEDEEENED